MNSMKCELLNNMSCCIIEPTSDNGLLLHARGGGK